MEKETNALPNATAETDTTVSQGEVASPVQEIAAQTQSGEEIHTDNNKDKGVSDFQTSIESDGADLKAQKRLEFEKLIKGDYKEFYEERIKENLSRRLRQNSLNKKRNEENTEIVEMLMDRYNISSGKVSELKNALENDNAYLAAEADKRGISIDDYKYIRKLENENRRLNALSSQYEAVREATESVNGWFRESEALKEVYPDFNIFDEARNPSFVSLVKSGIDVKTAYEVVHHNEIVSKAAQIAAKEAKKEATDIMRSKMMRPAENGLSSMSSAIFKNDVSSLSREQRADIAQRAARGERISF